MIHCHAIPNPRGRYFDRAGRPHAVISRPWESVPQELQATLHSWENEAAYARANGLTHVAEDVPMEVPLWRIRAVAELMPHPEAGTYLAAIDAAVAAMPGQAGVVARQVWTSGNVIERLNPLVLQLSAGLGLSDAEVDAVFLSAKSIA